MHEFKDESTDNQSYPDSAIATQHVKIPNSRTQEIPHPVEDPFESLDRFMDAMWQPRVVVMRPRRPPFAVPEADEEQVDDRKSPESGDRWDPFEHSRRMWETMTRASPFWAPDSKGTASESRDDPTAYDAYEVSFFRRPRRTRIARRTEPEASTPDKDAPSE